jgi:transcriptional regulator GlxA family with amidase domain
MFMKTIAIPALQTEESLSTIGALEILNESCSPWCQIAQGESGLGSPLFDVQVVSERGEPVKFTNGIILYPSHSIREVKPDIIIVPALGHELDAVLKRNQVYVDWVSQSYNRGSHVASICTGAFVLGAAGLLDGKRATTHWFFADEFKRRFPRVDLREQQMIVDEGDIVTCGAVTAYLNLIIYLIEKYFGHEIALRTAKMYLVDMDRPSQLPFQIYRFPITYSDGSITRIQDFIGEHFKEDLTIDDVAKRTGMSVRNFSRRFKSATGERFSNYIQKLRVETAKRLLESTDYSASEIMYQVGYNDDRSFRRLFKRQSGLSPKHYRTKFKIRFQNIALVRKPGNKRTNR